MNQIFSSFGIPLYVHKQLRKSCKILPNYEKRLFKVSPFGYYKEFYKETPAFFEEGVVQMSFKYSIDHFHYNSEKLLLLKLNFLTQTSKKDLFRQIPETSKI